MSRDTEMSGVALPSVYRFARPVMGILVRVFLCMTMCGSATAQRPVGGGLGIQGPLGGIEPVGQYPPQIYYIALELFRDGDLLRATEAFEDALTGSRKTVRGYEIEAIAPLAMLAECYWYLGDLETSMQYLNRCSEVAILQRGWLGSIDYQRVIEAGLRRTPPQWLWPEAAAISVLNTSDRVGLVSGTLLTEQAIQRGGTFQQRNVRQIDIVEVMRGLATSNYRRRVIMGGLSKDSRVGEAVLEAIKYPANLNVPIGRTLIGAMRATGYLSTAEDKRSQTKAKESTLAGRSVHPLTPVVGLSSLYVDAVSAPQASVAAAIQTANAAAALEQFEWIGPALQAAVGLSDVNSAGQVATVSGSIALSLNRQSPLAVAHCLVVAADASLVAGDLPSASRFLSDAFVVMNDRNVTIPRTRAYASYVAAKVATASGATIGFEKPSTADQRLKEVQLFATETKARRRRLIATPRYYQASQLVAKDSAILGGQTGVDLLARYTSGPPMEEWRRDPVDALSSFMFDRTGLHLRRLALLIDGQYTDGVLAAFNEALDYRLASQLPLTGRLQLVRRFAMASEETLTDDQRTERNGMAAILDLRNQLFAGGDMTTEKVQAAESKVALFALSRLKLPVDVLPRLSSKRPAANIKEGEALVTFIKIGNTLYGVLAQPGRDVSMWQVDSPSVAMANLRKLIPQIGAGNAKGRRIPDSEEWKETGANIATELFAGQLPAIVDGTKRLWIVPDGPLWFLPFDLLPLSDPSGPTLGESCDIAYTPTPGLALRAFNETRGGNRIAIHAKRFFAPTDADRDDAMVQSLLDVMEQPLRLPEDHSGPASQLQSLASHIMIAAISTPARKDLMSIPVCVYDSRSELGSLKSWLRLPAVVPQTIVLAGLRTPVDFGQFTDGREVFTMLATLHAAGVNEVLMSRWAVGGESTATLLRELSQEIPHTNLISAFKRSRAVLRNTELSPETEPLIGRSEKEVAGLSGEAPIFWAGYLPSVCRPLAP